MPYYERVHPREKDPTVLVRLYDQDWQILAQTTVVVKGETGQLGTFSGETPFSGYTGPAAIEVVDSGGEGVSHLSFVTLVEAP